MTEQIEQHLNEILELLKSGIYFASEQAPIFLQEILTYYTWYHASLMILFTLLAVITIIITVYLFKRGKAMYGDLQDGVMLSLVPSVMSVLWVLIATVNLLELLKVTLAPRLYLIETITKLF